MDATDQHPEDKAEVRPSSTPHSLSTDAELEDWLHAHSSSGPPNAPEVRYPCQGEQYSITSSPPSSTVSHRNPQTRVATSAPPETAEQEGSRQIAWRYHNLDISKLQPLEFPDPLETSSLCTALDVVRALLAL